MAIKAPTSGPVLEVCPKENYMKSAASLFIVTALPRVLAAQPIDPNDESMAQHDDLERCAPFSQPWEADFNETVWHVTGGMYSGPALLGTIPASERRFLLLHSARISRSWQPKHGEQTLSEKDK
jgi:hypothetical protein